MKEPAIRRLYVDTNYGQLHLRLAGYTSNALNNPLICLHMAPQSGEDFEAFMRLAAEDRLIIAPDYPGYGESDPIADDIPVSINVYASAIWQAINVLDLKTVEVLGYHTGSKVGIEMALQSPDRVAKLFCISLSNMSRKAYESSEINFAPLKQSDATNWLQKLKNYYDPKLPEATLKQKLTASIKVASRSHLGFIASHNYNKNIRRKLERLQTPVVLINPNDDLRAITPLAAKYIENCILIEKSDWLPGFLDLNPHSVLETISITSRNIEGLPGSNVASVVSAK